MASGAFQTDPEGRTYSATHNTSLLELQISRVHHRSEQVTINASYSPGDYCDCTAHVSSRLPYAI